jgi:hypothetical protein
MTSMIFSKITIACPRIGTVYVDERKLGASLVSRQATSRSACASTSGETPRLSSASIKRAVLAKTDCDSS